MFKQQDFAKTLVSQNLDQLVFHEKNIFKIQQVNEITQENV